MMNALSYRLGLVERNEPQWQSTVKTIVDIARENDIGADELRGMAKSNADELAGLLRRTAGDRPNRRTETPCRGSHRDAEGRHEEDRGVPRTARGVPSLFAARQLPVADLDAFGDATRRQEIVRALGACRADCRALRAAPEVPRSLARVHPRRLRDRRRLHEAFHPVEDRPRPDRLRRHGAAGPARAGRRDRAHPPCRRSGAAPGGRVPGHQPHAVGAVPETRGACQPRHLRRRRETSRLRVPRLRPDACLRHPRRPCRRQCGAGRAAPELALPSQLAALLERTLRRQLRQRSETAHRAECRCAGSAAQRIARRRCRHLAARREKHRRMRAAGRRRRGATGGRWRTRHRSGIRQRTPGGLRRHRRAGAHQRPCGADRPSAAWSATADEDDAARPADDGGDHIGQELPASRCRQRRHAGQCGDTGAGRRRATGTMAGRPPALAGRRQRGHRLGRRRPPHHSALERVARRKRLAFARGDRRPSAERSRHPPHRRRPGGRTTSAPRRDRRTWTPSSPWPSSTKSTPPPTTTQAR